MAKFMVPQPEVSLFGTLRSLFLSRRPELAELVQKRFPRNRAGEEALEYALELFVRMIPNLNIAFDGWRMFRLATETTTSLRAVGIMHVLPGSELPVEVTLSTDPDRIRYCVQIGVDGAEWCSLSESKRWKAVYLYAGGERGEQWVWSAPISGYF